MIELAPGIFILEEQLAFSFVRAAGPGGQHVNKTSTAVQLRLDVMALNLAPHVLEKLQRLAGKRLAPSGILIITSQVHRSQLRNREEVLIQLMDLFKRATEKPRPRVKTKPSKSSQKVRLESKTQRGKLKELRKKIKLD